MIMTQLCHLYNLKIPLIEIERIHETFYCEKSQNVIIGVEITAWWFNFCSLPFDFVSSPSINSKSSVFLTPMITFSAVIHFQRCSNDDHRWKRSFEHRCKRYHRRWNSRRNARLGVYVGCDYLEPLLVKFAWDSEGRQKRGRCKICEPKFATILTLLNPTYSFWCIFCVP